MVIPNQPPLTATKKSTPKPQTPGGVSTASSPPPVSPVPKPQHPMAPQPVPASYTTASTPSQPTFNVQMRSAQHGPQHQAPGHHFGQQPIRSPGLVQYMPAQPKGPDFAYGPPQPGFTPMGHQEQYHPGGPQVGGVTSRRPDPVPAQTYQPPGPKKTHLTDALSSVAPYTSGPVVPPKVGDFCLIDHATPMDVIFRGYCKWKKIFKEKLVDCYLAVVSSVIHLLPVPCLKP